MYALNWSLGEDQELHSYAHGNAHITISNTLRDGEVTALIENTESGKHRYIFTPTLIEAIEQIENEAEEGTLLNNTETDMEPPKAGQVYTHYRGNQYRVLGYITSADKENKGERLVHYQGLYGDYEYFVTTLRRFTSYVKGHPRFMLNGVSQIVEDSK